MKKIKVLIIGPVPPPSGGVSVHIARLLDKSNSQQEFEVAVADIRKLKMFSSQGKIPVLDAIAFFMSCTVVHVHSSGILRSATLAIARLAGKKTMVSVHNRREKNIIHADRIVNVFGEDAIPAYIPPPAPVQRINIVHGLIVTAVSASGKINADIYGVALLMDAIADLANERAVGLHIVDTTGQSEHIFLLKLTRLKAAGVTVKYTKGEVPDLLSKASVFVRATTTDGDSIMVREALEAGIPVVASDCVERPPGCILFRSGDRTSLRESLVQAFDKHPDPIPQQDFFIKIFQEWRLLAGGDNH